MESLFFDIDIYNEVIDLRNLDKGDIEENKIYFLQNMEPIVDKILNKLYYTNGISCKRDCIVGYGEGVFNHIENETISDYAVIINLNTHKGFYIIGEDRSHVIDGVRNRITFIRSDAIFVPKRESYKQIILTYVKLL